MYDGAFSARDVSVKALFFRAVGLHVLFVCADSRRHHVPCSDASLKIRSQESEGAEIL